MKLLTDQQHRLAIAIDHGQFLMIDRDSEVDPDAYNERAQHDGVAGWTGGVAVFCDSHWTVFTPLVVTLVDEHPTPDLASFDHVAIAGLSCPSGELRVFSPEETGVNERGLSIPPGNYGLMICGDGFGTGDEYGDNGQDAYTLTLWPCDSPPAPCVLKRGIRDA